MEVEDRVSFQEVAGALKRRWRLLVALPLALAAITSAITLLQRRDYKATALIGLSASAPIDSRSASLLFRTLLPVEDVLRKFKLDAPPYNVSENEFWDNIASLKIVKGSAFIEISVFTGEPRLSRDIANYIAEQLWERTIEFYRLRFLTTEESLQKELSTVKRRMNSAEDALLKFKQTARLSEMAQDINALLAERERLLFLRLENDLRLKDVGRDDLLREREEVLKLLWSDDGFSELKILADRNDDLLAFRRALYGKMLEAKSELSGVLEAANGGLGAGARNESVKSAGADDAVRAAAALEKIRAEKKALEDERRSASAALPALEIEIQVSGSKLKALKKTMERARRAGAASGGERASLAAPRENGALDGGDAFDARRGAVAARIVNEELRLVELAEKKRQYEKRIARIDSELPATAGRLRRRKAKYLLLEISRMAGEIKRAEAEILANERKMAERRARRRSLLAKAGALGDAALDIGKLEAPLAPPSVSARERGFEDRPADGFPTDRSISERLGDRLRSLDKDILTAAHLKRRRKKWIDAELKRTEEKLAKNLSKKTRLDSIHTQMKNNILELKDLYDNLYEERGQERLNELKIKTEFEIVGSSKLPKKAFTERYLGLVVLLSLIFGLLFAMFVSLFLEFQKRFSLRA